MDILDELFKKTPKAVLPLWEVQLNLVLARIEEEGEGRKDATPPKVDVLFNPSMQKFQGALKRLFKQYEDLVCAFVPISADRRIKSFLQHSKFDLLMLLGEQTKTAPAPWPDVESLLHEYGPYMQSVAYIKKTVAVTMSSVQKFISVSFC